MATMLIPNFRSVVTSKMAGKSKQRGLCVLEDFNLGRIPSGLDCDQVSPAPEMTSQVKGAVDSTGYSDSKIKRRCMMRNLHILQKTPKILNFFQFSTAPKSMRNLTYHPLDKSNTID
ncbi:hypothetical protein ACOSQ2_019952 [Xanthoceras sorbifolium]